MKISEEYQRKYKNNQFYNEKIRQCDGISKNVKLHNEYMSPTSSAASCLNVLGYLNQNQDKIIPFFNSFGLNIENVLPFPSGINLSGEIYNDKGPIVFEWIGPKKSPINEKGGSRGQRRTSIDAYLIAKIKGTISQLLIEWKFTEKFNSNSYLHKFGGLRGIERSRRYSTVLAKQRNLNFPFKFSDDDTIGLQDFSYEPFYQLLRITLLAKETTPLILNEIEIQDYYVIHLVHSENDDLLKISKDHMKYCPGLENAIGNDLHETWKSLLSAEEKKHFIYGYWNKSIPVLADPTKYLDERYL